MLLATMKVWINMASSDGGFSFLSCGMENYWRVPKRLFQG